MKPNVVLVLKIALYVLHKNIYTCHTCLSYLNVPFKMWAVLLPHPVLIT